MGTVTRRGRNSDGFIFGILYTSSLLVLSDSGLSPNDFFWEETDLEGSGFVVYCAHGYPLLGFGGT